MRLRPWIVRVHLWLGLTIGALWALQGLTGAMLVFSRDIQAASYPASPPGPLLPLATLFEKAEAAAGAPVTMVETFSPRRELFLAHYKNARDHPMTMVIDGRSGAAFDRRDPEAMLPTDGSTWKWLVRFHEGLLSEEAGPFFIGASGVLLLTSVLLGLYLAWPRPGHWKAAFQVVRWRTPSQRLFGWHRLVGLTAGLALFVIVPFGVYMAFKDPIREWMAEEGWYRTFKPEAVEDLPSFAIEADQALAIARAPFPGAAIYRVALPTKNTPAYVFRLLQKEELRRSNGTTTVAIDPWNGQLRYVYDPRRARIGNVIDDVAYPIHNADISGPVGRVLLFLTGLALPTLYVLGVAAWLRKRRRRGAA